MSDLLSVKSFDVFLSKIRSFYCSSGQFISAENEILDLILEGYGTVTFFDRECNVLQAILQYRVVMIERKTMRGKTHSAPQADKTEMHFYLAKVNERYMRLARDLFKRVLKALYPVDINTYPIEEEETCCVCLISRNIMPMCETPNMHLCCRVCYIDSLRIRAFSYFAEHQNFEGFTEKCFQCCGIENTPRKRI